MAAGRIFVHSVFAPETKFEAHPAVDGVDDRRDIHVSTKERFVKRGQIRAA
jgi:hypothetical protein